jgi:hypothetical protein
MTLSLCGNILPFSYAAALAGANPTIGCLLRLRQGFLLVGGQTSSLATGTWTMGCR